MESQAAMKQEELALVSDYPRARNTDPDTSHEAAGKIKRSGKLASQQHMTLEAVRRWPGRTATELAHELVNYTGFKDWRHFHDFLHKRLPELEPIHVCKGESRKCERSRHRAVTWWPK